MGVCAHVGVLEVVLTHIAIVGSQHLVLVSNADSYFSYQKSPARSAAKWSFQQMPLTFNNDTIDDAHAHLEYLMMHTCYEIENYVCVNTMYKRADLADSAVSHWLTRPSAISHTAQP